MRMLATQAMSNAAYFSTGSLNRELFNHYGLGLEFYTHFTSPIRRYADVVVHRYLMAAIEGTGKEILMNNCELQNAAEHMNRKHRAAQQAQKQSQELFLGLFFKEKTDDEICMVDAVLLQLRNNGFIAYIPRYAIKGAVFLKNKDNLVIEVNDKGETKWVPGSLSVKENSVVVQLASKRQEYTLLQHVTVCINIKIRF